MKNNKLALIALSMAPVAAFAETTTAVATSMGSGKSMSLLAAAICMGLAASVVGYSQSKAASTAFEGIGRNPGSAKGMFTPLLLSLALMESLVLFAFVIAFLIIGKV